MKSTHINMLAILISMLFVFSSDAPSQDVPPLDHTTFYRIGKTSKGNHDVGVEMYNGRFWNALNSEQKESFLAGLTEGVQSYYIVSGVGASEKQSDYLKIRDTFFAGDFYPKELAGVIDGIYADAANVRIPICEAFRSAVRKAKGLSQQQMDDLLSQLREQFSK